MLGWFYCNILQYPNFITWLAWGTILWFYCLPVRIHNISCFLCSFLNKDKHTPFECPKLTTRWQRKFAWLSILASTHRTNPLKFINQECSFKTLRVTEYDNNLCCPRSQGFRGPWNELPPPKRLKTKEKPAYLQFNFVVSIKCLFFLNMGSRIFHFDFQILKTQHSKINEMKTSRKVQSDLKHN